MTQKRKKISTTVAPDGYALLERIIASGKARNLAEAMDLVLEEARRRENRARLERLMEAYYDHGSPDATSEENEIAVAFSQSAHEIKLDE
jgi:hypothetical protein